MAKLKEKVAVADEARKIWKVCHKVKSQAAHPYLVNKNVTPVRFLRMISVPELRKASHLSQYLNFEKTTSLLVLPACSFDDPDDKLRLWSLQFITESGKKRFLPKGRITGCFAPLNGLYGPSRRTLEFQIAIGEGFATVQSVMQRAIEPADCFGVVAFSCHGLVNVAPRLRLRYPKALISVLGDIGNGSDQARQAANAVGGQVFFPEFSESQIAAFVSKHGKRPTDWNDFYEVLEAENEYR